MRMPSLHLQAVGALAVLALVAWAAPARAQTTPPAAVLTLEGAPSLVFDPAKDACDGYDTPDVPARAYRDAKGEIVLFALHFENRALRGPSFEKLKLDCRVVFRGSGSPDPAAHDDRAWIAATWTNDGKAVAGLVHHEYQAHGHPGRCAFREYIACWYNTILAVRSDDGGARFAKAAAGSKGSPVIAAHPLPQEVGQGRHRGFFNPSNIVSDGRFAYFLGATTGWSGQASGACLFRNSDPLDPSGWRAWNGRDFAAAFPDPLVARRTASVACAPVGLFPAPVGSLTRHRASGAWIAVFQAQGGGERFPVSGIWYAASNDLLNWGPPRLLMAGATLYDDACKAGGRLINYPSLIDPEATGRNFDDTGDTADLFLVTLAVDGCDVKERRLLRQRIRIEVR